MKEIREVNPMKKNGWRYRSIETAKNEFTEKYISWERIWWNKSDGYEWQQGLWWKISDKQKWWSKIVSCYRRLETGKIAFA